MLKWTLLLFFIHIWNLPFSHRFGCYTVNFSSHPSKKSCINVLFKMFSMISIDKQSLDHKFWGFILILSVPWGQLRTKCPCHTIFFYRSVTFFICFCGNTDVLLDDNYGSDGFILTTWTVSPCEVVKLKLMRFTIQSIYISESWHFWFLNFISLAYHFSPAYWYHNLKQANITAKIFISKIKYLKMLKCLKFIYRPLISNFSKILYQSDSTKFSICLTYHSERCPEFL